MGDYAGLQGTIDEIVREAIDWHMQDNFWLKSGDGYRLQGAYGWTVPGPEAGAGAFPVSFEEPRSGTTMTYDFHSTVYEPLRESIQSQFDPWLTMPQPEDFGDVCTGSYAGMEKISAGQEINGDSVTENVDLSAAVTGATDACNGQQGETIKAFKARYMDRMPGVIRNHCAAAADLTEIALGEQLLWRETQKSLASTADAMLKAMQARSGGGGGEILLSIVGAALSIGSAIATGGWSTVLTVAGAATGVGGTLAGGGEEQRVPLSGDDASAVIDSVHEVLVDLNEKIKAEEQALKDKATSRTGQMDGSDYDLSVPTSLYEPSEEDDYTGGGNMMQYQAELLADLYSDGGHLATIANQLRASSSQLEGVSAFSAFSRATVGLVNDGPYSEWNALRLQIIDFLETNRQACLDAADQLEIAAKFIGDTDTAVSQELGQHGDEVENAQTFSLAPPPHVRPPGGFGGY